MKFYTLISCYGNHYLETINLHIYCKPCTINYKTSRVWVIPCIIIKDTDSEKHRIMHAFKKDKPSNWACYFQNFQNISNFMYNYKSNTLKWNLVAECRHVVLPLLEVLILSPVFPERFSQPFITSGSSKWVQNFLGN